MKSRRKIGIVGTVGVPGGYGGFETLAENLVRQLAESDADYEIYVYCSSHAISDRHQYFCGAKLIYIPLRANGLQSIFYDAVSLLHAVFWKFDTVLVLGVSGAIAFPLVQLISNVRIITNLDGIEWRRAKWGASQKKLLLWFEMLAVKYSDLLVADNRGISEYLRERYGVGAQEIAYGGNPIAISEDENESAERRESFFLALCRIEPENNVEMILSAFQEAARPLVFVGNWQQSHFSRSLHKEYSRCKNISLLSPIYDPEKLHCLRRAASCYVHGHSAGGTNPSLVEMLHYGSPVLAYDCSFNRHTTENLASFFSDKAELIDLVKGFNCVAAGNFSAKIYELAQRKYTWEKVAAQYKRLLFTA